MAQAKRMNNKLYMHMTAEHDTNQQQDFDIACTQSAASKQG